MASHINLHTSLSRKTAANQKLGPLSETDICMSCGHPRSQHTASGCMHRKKVSVCHCGAFFGSRIKDSKRVG